MSKKLTNDWFKEQRACVEGYEWVLKRNYDDGVRTIKELIKIDKLDWANWTIARALNRKDKIRYSVYAAEQVLEIFENKYPDDKRPREAIEAAKMVLKNDTVENRSAAYAAYAAYAAANAADAAADAADAVMKKKILLYGIKLMGDQK